MYVWQTVPDRIDATDACTCAITGNPVEMLSIYLPRCDIADSLEDLDDSWGHARCYVHYPRCQDSRSRCETTVGDW